MEKWLLDNMVWVAAGVVLFTVGGKILVGRLLQRLMAADAEAAARRSASE